MLEFDEASKRFGAVATLDGCAFSARPGRLTGFLGPNGAGKTTAMRAVFGLVEFDAGAVRWRGAPIGASERARFGYTPEERGLYPRMQVRDQLVYLGELCGRKRRVVSQNVDRWMERLGRADRAGDRLDALSHGNQQRVQLIGALVDEPELLVLDEPFSGLDPLAMGAMAGLFAELTSAGATVLFSSHQLDLVEDLCEDVVIIAGGRVVRAGALDELGTAVMQRYVDISHRGRTPDWSTLASGVVEEKTSRAVEVLLARVPARNLLAGKVTGIGLPGLGLGPVAVTALAALAAMALIDSFDVPAARGSVIAWAVVWFVLGYALYAMAFGTLGSLASRTEDAQSVGGPVTVAAIAALVQLGGWVCARAILPTGPTLALRDMWQDR